jgi:hypothetical protein
MAYMNTSQANISHLSSATGLAPSVAQAWLANEGQSTPNPTNPLNIRTGNTPNQTGSIGGFGTYASPAAGLDAAAWLLRVSSHYTGIISAIKSGTPLQQAQAIQNSPWAAGHYSYSKISNIVSGHSSVPSGGTSTPLASVWGSNLPAFGTLFNLPTGTILTAADTKQLADAAVQANKNAGNADPLGAGEAKTRAGMDLFIGSSWTKATQDAMAAAFFGGASQTPGTNLPGIPDVQTAVTFVGIILVGVAFLGLGGLIALRKK